MERTALSTFVGVYLDEDRFEEFGDVIEAADAFVREQPRRASELPSVISTILDSEPTETDLESVLDSYGIAVIVEGTTYREWLTQIADHVRAATGGASATD